MIILSLVSATSVAVAVYSFAKMRMAKEKFNALVDAVPCTISWLNSDLEYVAANKELANMLDLNQGDFVGQKAGFNGGNEDYINFVESVFEVEDQKMEYYFQVKTPEKNRHFMSVANKYNNNKEVAIIGVDITEQVEAQKLINDQQQTIVTSAKLASLGEMAASIGHEINNPLAVISGHSELLKELVEQGEIDKNMFVDTVDHITETVHRIAKIVQGLRFFSREGTRDPFEPTDLRKVADHTLELCSHRFKHAEIDVRCDFPEEGSTVECKAVQIQQILLNLLNNAVDALEPLDKKWIQIGLQNFEKHAELSVTDSGSGIPREMAERILEPFFTTKEPGKGTGLGLSISRKIAGRHGGAFEIDFNSPNTRFVLKLPYKQSEPLVESSIAA